MPSIPIIIPKIGESVEEATINQWLKSEGDTIQKDEIFVEVSTDKVNSELPSEYEGVLVKKIALENENVKIGEAIGQLEVSEEDFQQFQQLHKTEKITSENTPEFVKIKETTNKLAQQMGDTFLSPVVRKMIAENHLSIEEVQQIPQSGRGNRLSKRDVRAYLQKKNPSEESIHLSQKLDLEIAAEDKVVPISGIRKKAAETLEQSYREIPHVTTIIEVDVTQMVEERNQMKKVFFEESGLKLTYTHFCFYAVIKALQSYPELNSWYNQDEWIFKKEINLGFATSIEGDLLIVPTIKNAQDLSFSGLVESVNTIAQKAKQNKMQSSDFRQTTFTVSNSGIFGSLMGTPIITKPQVGVLALGAIRDQLEMNEEGRVEKRKKMFASLSYDHRVINGALASKFLMSFKTFLQSKE